MIHVGINAKHKYPSGQAPGLTVIRCILVQSVTYFEAIKTKLMTNIHINTVIWLRMNMNLFLIFNPVAGTCLNLLWNTT